MNKMSLQKSIQNFGIKQALKYMEKAIRILVHSCGLTMEIIRMQHSRGQICRMDEEYELRFRQ